MQRELMLRFHIRVDDSEPAVQYFRVSIRTAADCIIGVLRQTVGSDFVDSKDGLQLCIMLLKSRVIMYIWWRNILYNRQSNPELFFISIISSNLTGDGL
jgi:hypothetical protein